MHGEARGLSHVNFQLFVFRCGARNLIGLKTLCWQTAGMYVKSVHALRGHDLGVIVGQK